MEYWIPIVYEPDAMQYLEVARAAERVGFTGVGIADHVVIPRDRNTSGYSGGGDPFARGSDHLEPFSMIAAMSQVTTTLRFATYVYVLPMHNVFTTAKACATVSDLTAGRFAFGVGVGWFKDEIRMLGEDPSTRGRRMDEMLEILQGFWNNDTYEFQGDFYNFGPASMFPRPKVPPPLWIGGGRPGLERSVRFDGWLGMIPADHPQILDELAVLRRRWTDEHGPKTYQTCVVASMEPYADVSATRDLHERLASQGVTGITVVPWAPLDPAYASVDSKVKAIESWADRYIH